ncbi:hypothetical protein L798_09646 [Zootermopsis nevadensis]|uniref:CREB/ATF bZIP transcription factor n=1 Tax=Zootermopsis nevadensis TaxID=136037 RepID=A0A067R9E5_ZOONE|nr:hypothetical protein L798_09646 [Zootermopsis nevadensis]
MAKWRCSDHLSGVWAAELSGHGEVSCGSFISKSENERKTEKLDFKKSGHVRKLPKCSSKNAIMTRINRLNYMMQSHQSEIARLSDENTKLKETLEGQSSLVCSLRKEVLYLKGVLANNKEIRMLLQSIQNTGLPVTTSISKHTLNNNTHSAPDHNYVHTGSDSSICSRFSDVVDGSSTTFTLDKKEQIYIKDDVALSLSMPHHDILDDTLLSPSDRNLYDTEFCDCYSVQPTTLDLPVTGFAAGDEPFMDVGVCLQVAKRRVSLEFCSTCSSSALSTWDDLDVIK